MTVAETGKEEVLMDGEKERSAESKEGESDELKEKDTNWRAEGEESESSEEQKDKELGEMRRKFAEARSENEERQRYQGGGMRGLQE